MENTQQEQINNVALNNVAAEQGMIIEKAEVVKLGEWMVTMLITTIPFVNLIMLFVWAFSKGENPNKRNWARANLIWGAIAIALMILIFSSMMAFFSSMVNSAAVK